MFTKQQPTQPNTLAENFQKLSNEALGIDRRLAELRSEDARLRGKVEQLETDVLLLGINATELTAARERRAAIERESTELRASLSDKQRLMQRAQVLLAEQRVQEQRAYRDDLVARNKEAARNVGDALAALMEAVEAHRAIYDEAFRAFPRDQKPGPPLDFFSHANPSVFAMLLPHGSTRSVCWLRALRDELGIITPEVTKVLARAESWQQSREAEERARVAHDREQQQKVWERRRLAELALPVVIDVRQESLHRQYSGEILAVKDAKGDLVPPWER